MFNKTMVTFLDAVSSHNVLHPYIYQTIVNFSSKDMTVHLGVGLKGVNMYLFFCSFLKTKRSHSRPSAKQQLAEPDRLHDN